MPFEIVWTDRAKKDLHSLEKEISARVIKKIQELSEQEKPFLEKLAGLDYYKARVSEHRTIFKMFPAARKLFVMRVRHRRNAYKNL